jgi:hypothetical protein
MSLSCFALNLGVCFETVTISPSCFSLILGICFRDGNYISFLLCADFKSLF